MSSPPATPYNEGEILGAYKILEYLGNDRPGSAYQQYVVACRVCGTQKRISRKSLYESESNRSTMCAACYWKANHSGSNAPVMRHCKVCCGLPWRRPKRGPCACGELRAVEVMPRPEVMHSSAGQLENSTYSERVFCVTPFESRSGNVGIRKSVF